jgi:hypothetical protein
MNIIGAIDDENLLGGSIKDPVSFAPWRALMAAAFGLPLDAGQLKLYRECTGRTSPPRTCRSPASGSRTRSHAFTHEGPRPSWVRRTSRKCPPAQFRSVFMCIGRRGGKSVCMALLAVYLAVFRDWRPKLTAGERAVILLVAGDREQAKIIYRYIVGILNAPILNNLIINYTADSLDLKGWVTIEVVTRSYRAVRGRSVCAALLDEVAFFRSDDSANPDTEVVAAIRPSMATFGPEAMLAASSPYARRGVLWDAYRKYFGKDDPSTLVWQAPTRTMNPSVPQEFIDEEYERDSISAAAEYGAQFRSDVDAFVRAEVVEDAVVNGRYELAPSPLTYKYRGFVDPSGGSSDSFTLSIAHGEGDIAVLDCIREFRPPFSPENVVAELAGVLRSYGLNEVTGDAYSGEFVRELFRDKGISYNISRKSKSQIYVDLLPMLNSGRVVLLDHPKMVAQLCSLERRTTRGTGRDIVDHPPNAHDDLINAAAGALCLAELGPVPMKFHVPVSVGRSEVMADYVAGLFDPAGGGSSMPPCGWPADDPRAGGGLDQQLAWWPGCRQH